MNCLDCGEKVKRLGKLFRVYEKLFGMVWRCPGCSMKCWQGEGYRFYGRQSIHTTQCVPAGCLFVVKGVRG